MNYRWITIKGRKMLPLSLFYVLGLHQYGSAVCTRGLRFFNEYASMTRIIKEFIGQYNDGKTVISDKWESYINMCGLSLPKERKLPEAIVEMFDEMEKKLRFDFSPFLDEAVEYSIEKLIKQITSKPSQAALNSSEQ